jgi:hypothetical protein
MQQLLTNANSRRASESRAWPAPASVGKMFSLKLGKSFMTDQRFIGADRYVVTET